MRAWYLLLLVLGAAGALAVVWYFHLGRAATLATLLPTVAPAYLAWKSFRHDRVEATAVDLETVADHLTQAVKKQWDDEAAIRRVNDPYPLPVAWRPAEADLVEPWGLLTEVAQAWPGGPPGDPAQWSADAAGLAGADAQIGEVFTQRVPTRRLVVLGEPGSGKTMLLIRLLQELIEQRADRGPVPVLFSLASWDPAHQPLGDWLAEQLRRSHPGLRAPAPAAIPGADEVDLARALLDTRRILPLLDGFDELPPTLHTLALDALNRALPAKQPLVVASRATVYRDALTRPGAMVRLNGAAGVHLLPLTADQAATYLRRDAGGENTPAADRWANVIVRLGTDTPIGQALCTPLGLFLARTIYNPRPHTLAAPAPAPVPHPDELCDTTVFPTRTALDTHLFNAFIPATYTPHGPNPSRWPAPQAHLTLAFLARHLEVNRGGSPDLAWWELPHVLPARTLRLTFGLVAFLVAFFVVGLTNGLAYGLTDGLTQGLTNGLAVGLAVGLLAGRVRPNIPSARLGWSSDSLVDGLVVFFVVGLTSGLTNGLVYGLTQGLTMGPMHGLAVGLAVGLLAGRVRPNIPSARLGWSSDSLVDGLAYGLLVGLAFGLVVGLVFGLLEGLTFGLVFGLVFGLKSVLRAEKPDPTTMIGPAKLLIRDRHTFLVAFLVAFLVVGLTAGLTFGLTFGLSFGLSFGLVVGLTFGLSFGLVYGPTEAVVWGAFAVATAYFAIQRRTPWDLMAFLQDAHEHRGVLRQVGAVYQFRHLDLQRHFAQQPGPPTA